MRKVIGCLLIISLFCLFFHGSVAKAAMGDHSGNLTGATWYWPLHGFSSAAEAYADVTSSYGHRGSPYNADHRGVDIAAEKGTPVFPVRGGTVSQVHSVTYGTGGRYVIIDHHDGYFSVYMHLSRIHVSLGQSVDVNTKIGAVGASGNGSETYYGYHLHLGIHYGSAFTFECSVNPCPSGYTAKGDSFSAVGGRPVGSATITYVIRPEDLDPPAAPNIRVAEHHAAGDPVTVTWDPVDGAASYRYYVSEYPEAYAYQESVRSGSTHDTSVSLSQLPAGEYSAFIHAESTFGVCSAQSNWGSFTVEQPEYIPVKTASYDGRTYALYDDTLSWSSARRLCERLGGHLVTITSQEENAFVQELVQAGAHDRYWLGAHNDSPWDYQNSSYAYEWVTGEAFSYADWADGEPNGSGTDAQTEHFAHMVKTCSSQWNDTYNTDKSNGFICEIEPAPTAPRTTSTVTRSGNACRVVTQLERCPSSGNVFVAGYKDGRFAALTTAPCRTESVTCTLYGDIDAVRVIVLDGATMASLCGVEDIPSSQWSTAE